MKNSSLNIIFEDDVLLVCNKPAGLMVEPDRNNHPNLQDMVKKYLAHESGNTNPYAQHLHRIDRPVSGIVLFTKDKNHLRNLSEQFAERKVEKRYLALSSKAPEKNVEVNTLALSEQSKFALDFSGEYHALEHWHRKEKKKAVLVPEGTEYAEQVKMFYRVKNLGNYFLWDIKLITGKFHQIRAQLASLKCPVLGDELYGSDKKYKNNAIALHAHYLKIEHPVKKKQQEFFANAIDLLNTISFKKP
ncbi:MAG: RluA family pseudouridine synthase [Sphingobacteriaceae bacterium]|nr:RluA family pseudouridine synthase [Sphingobacteriaceae bacterium]